MRKLLKWLVKEPSKEPETRLFEIVYDNDDERVSEELTLAQSIVGGYIEPVPVGPHVVCFCNEDGIAMNLVNNCGFLGTIVFMKEVPGEDETAWGSLNDEEIRKCTAWLQKRKETVHPRNSSQQIIFGQDITAFLNAKSQNILQEWESL